MMILSEAIIRVLIGRLVLHAFECVLTHVGKMAFNVQEKIIFIRILKKAQCYIPSWLSSVGKVCMKGKLGNVGRKIG